MHVTARRGRCGGFTLLEVLVVVVIIAVLTSLAVLSVGVLGTDRELDAEGDRYTDVATASLEQAQLEGRDFGIWFGPGRYQVLAYVQRRQRWESLADDRLYESHALPAGVAAHLELEGRTVPIDSDRPGTAHVPQVLLYASGDVAPYHLVLSRDGSPAQWVVDGEPDGTLHVSRPGSKP